MLKYFEKNGVRKCTKEENPAEYILEAIGAGVNGKSYTDWSDVWKKSSEYAEVQKKLDEVDTMTPSTSDVDGPPREFATSQLYQCWEVYKRLNTIWWRSPFYNMGRIGNGLYIGLLLGFSYWDFGVSASDLRLRVWILFQTMLLGMLLIFSAMPNFLIQREYFRRCVVLFLSRLTLNLETMPQKSILGFPLRCRLSLWRYLTSSVSLAPPS